MSDKESHKQINIEIKKLMVDCIYSGRGHQQTGQFWSAINHKLGIPGTILSSVLGVGAAGTALLGNKWISASLAILSVIFAGLNSFLKPNDISDAHLIKGAQFISLRNRARLLQKVEVQSGLSVKDAIAKLTQLRSEYDALNMKPPRNIPRFAYDAAKKNIAKGESDYENDPLWKTLD